MIAIVVIIVTMLIVYFTFCVENNTYTALGKVKLGIVKAVSRFSLSKNSFT